MAHSTDPLPRASLLKIPLQQRAIDTVHLQRVGAAGEIIWNRERRVEAPVGRGRVVAGVEVMGVVEGEAGREAGELAEVIPDARAGDRPLLVDPPGGDEVVGELLEEQLVLELAEHPGALADVDPVAQAHRPALVLVLLRPPR